MSTAGKPRDLAAAYAKAAREYLRRLPLEHFLEATAQARQREITLESLALVTARRSDVQVFNELLVQYPKRGRKKPGQVVPDNMIVVWPEPIRAEGSFDLPLQPVGPFWVLEYVSRHNRRKDYEESFEKYERDLKVPYYLLFYPDDQELNLYRHTAGKYVSVKPTSRGRYPISDLDLEIGLHLEWVRFWHKGALLPLPAELQNDLDTARRELQQERKARLAAEHEVERLRAQVAELQLRPPKDL